MPITLDNRGLTARPTRYRLIVNAYLGSYLEGEYDDKWAAKRAMNACMNASVVSFTIDGPLDTSLYNEKGEYAGSLGH